MTEYERVKAKLIAQGFEIDAYEGIDQETREEHLVLSYWGLAHIDRNDF